MGRAAGVSRRRRKTVHFKSKHKLSRQKSRLLKKNVEVAQEDMKKEWNKKKSVNKNLSSMGLMNDPNELFKAKKNPDGTSSMEIDVSSSDVKSSVVKRLEEKANVPQEKRFKLSPEMCKLCVFMMTKYEDDWERMQMDKANTYQMSAGQLKKLIGKFLSIPGHRRAYERARAELQAEADVDEKME